VRKTDSKEAGEKRGSWENEGDTMYGASQRNNASAP